MPSASSARPAVVDPRRHDAVLFRGAGPDPDARDRLAEANIRVVTLDADAVAARVAAESGLRPDRCVVIDAAGGEIVVRGGFRRMSQLPDAAAPGTLAALTGRGCAVFFDFDGTLSRIVDDPDAAHLVPGASAALTALAAECPVGVLSGRDLADVRDRVGLPGIWYAGSHGFESVDPEGRPHSNAAAAAAVPELAAAARALQEELGALAGVRVEHKRFGVAVHYRNAARGDVPTATAAVQEAGRRRGLRVTTGREVIELRPDVDWDKGATLRWILPHLARDPGGTPPTPVYVGDDITDEDAFDAVGELGGTAIMVSHTEDGDRQTAAHLALRDPDAVVAFTAALAARLRR